jgi:hypothetical protein
MSNNILTGDDFSEEVRQVWECSCGQFNEECDDIDNIEEVVYCDCGKEYKVIA